MTPQMAPSKAKTLPPPASECAITVRPFQAGDASAVQRIFEEGLTSTIAPTMKLALFDPLFLAIMGAACAISAATAVASGPGAMARAALTAAVIAVAAVAVWVGQTMAAYISASIAGDLAHIEEWYIRNRQGEWRGGGAE